MLREYERAIEAAKTPEEIWRALSDYFAEGPVTAIGYLHLPPLGAPGADRPRIFSEGFPDALVARYFEDRLYRDNPALDQSQADIQPIYWDELQELELSERQAAFLAEFRTSEIGDGVGIRCWGPNGRAGQCSLRFRRGLRRLPPETLKEYQWACQLAHLRYCEMLAPTLGPAPSLSDRETEVLAWVARGKSNETIGEILGISAHTVNAHMRRIFLKLGVFDRITAAIRGIGTGLIRAGT
jgi:LuxR family transcriptional regulator/LuxR family quorum-sensing system transcriptional regulator CciR